MYDEVKECFIELKKLHKEDASVREEEADFFIEIGESHKAIESFNQAISKHSFKEN